MTIGNDWKDYEPYYCEQCGHELESEPCHSCFGKGYFDEYDYDPINFDSMEYTEVCEVCNGDGLYLTCPNAQNHKENLS